MFGGLVLRELNADYLMMFGRDWLKNSPTEFAFLYTYSNLPTIAHKRVVILSNVLGDRFNLGYEKLSNLVVSKVNGQSISSIEDMKLKLKLSSVQRDGVEFAQFDFKNGDLIALPYSGLNEAHKRIGSAYGIRDAAAFFVR